MIGICGASGSGTSSTSGPARVGDAGAPCTTGSGRPATAVASRRPSSDQVGRPVVA